MNREMQKPSMLKVIDLAFLFFRTEWTMMTTIGSETPTDQTPEGATEALGAETGVGLRGAERARPTEKTVQV